MLCLVVRLSCLCFLSCSNEILIKKAGKQYQTVITQELLAKFGKTKHQVVHRSLPP